MFYNDAVDCSDWGDDAYHQKFGLDLIIVGIQWLFTLLLGL